MSTECGGNYSDASGALFSPSYPNAYPELADCIYLISQPSGTFINISFDTMDIDCQGTTSDFIEMRDGSSRDSPLMGQFCGKSSNPVMTTQNHLRVRSVKKKYKQNSPNTMTLIIYLQILLQLLCEWSRGAIR